MVSSHVPDAIYAPNQVIQSLWKTSKESQPELDIAKLIDGFSQVVETHFQSVLGSGSGLKEIPSPRTSYALETLPEQTLIRMRLMIQDNSISPEIYLAQQPDGLPGGWALELPPSPPVEGQTQPQPAPALDNFDYSKLRERHVLWAIRVPGESSWPSDMLDGSLGHSTEPIETNKDPSTYAYKSPNGELGLQLKLYGQAPKLSLTDVITVVGIFDREPFVGNQSHDSPLAPTMHVVYWHSSPTILEESDFVRQESADLDNGTDWQALVSWIADALGGDQDVAEWIALCIASGGRDAKPPTNTPISLTLASFPPAPAPNATPTIVSLLEQLLPLVSHIPLTLASLNTTSMSPYSEISREDLNAGRLQLPSGSVVIFDERIEEGKLIEKGVENVRAIQDLLLRQTLAYRFPYSSFDFKTNINSVVLTEGKSEALFAKTDLCVPVRPRISSDLYAPLSTCERVRSLRKLMFQMKSMNQTIPKAEPALTGHVQDMFVRDRQAERASGGRKDDTSAADEYGLRMRLSRTMAIALGLSEITCDVFDRVVALDKRRIQRLKDVPLGSGPTQPTS